MRIRRIIIGLLAVANIAFALYVFVFMQKPFEEINAMNVTVNTVPDQTESQIHPDFVKEEFVLVLPEGENVALDKKVEANNFNDVYTPRKVVDGVALGVSYWEGKPNSYPNIITVDLDSKTTIHAIRICLSPVNIWGKRTQAFSVKISNDGTNYEELVPIKEYVFDPDTGNQVQIAFDEIETQFVQLEFTSNTGAGGGQIAEFEIYH